MAGEESFRFLLIYYDSLILEPEKYQKLRVDLVVTFFLVLLDLILVLLVLLGCCNSLNVSISQLVKDAVGRVDKANGMVFDFVLVLGCIKPVLKRTSSVVLIITSSILLSTFGLGSS